MACTIPGKAWKNPSTPGGSGRPFCSAPAITRLACPPCTNVSPGVFYVGEPSVVSIGGAGRPRVPLKAIATLQDNTQSERPSNPTLQVATTLFPFKILVFGLKMDVKSQ